MKGGEGGVRAGEETGRGFAEGGGEEEEQG